MGAGETGVIPQEEKLLFLGGVFERRQPASARAIRALGIPLERLDTGKFRQVFAVGGVEAVVKIPRRYVAKPGDHEWDDPRMHARREIRTIAAIRGEERLSHLRRYLPAIYYSSLETGIVVMKRYRHRPRGNPEFGREERLLARFFREALSKDSADYVLNLMRDEALEPVVIDLGY
jgi:hypothetical protein